MSTHLKAGEIIPLVAHLECPEGVTFYVEAILKKPDRTALPASPVDLTDEGEGLFFDDSVLMPNYDFVTVTYKIYEDAGKLTESEDYCPVTVVFNREIPDTSNEENLASIELELELSRPFLNLGLSSTLAELAIDRPSIGLQLRSINALLDISPPSMDLKIDPIALELNLECCS